jgi:hypothetical protein
MQHGGAPGALIARAIQALAPEMRVARITYEFLGPVPLAPCTVRTAIVRPGRRFQLAEAELDAGGRTAVKARAVLLRRGEVDLPAAALPVRDATFPGPDEGAPADPGATWGPEVTEGFHRTGMDIRFVRGSIAERGPAAGWFRLAFPLVEGEEEPAIARAVAAADFGNGASRVLDFQTHLFVNTDLTVHLVRDPVGPWVLLDATTWMDPAGAGLATSTIHDQHGPIGQAHQTLFVDGR